jgi:hypothetical protein
MIGTYALTIALAGWQAPVHDSLLAEGIRLAPMQPAAALVRFEALIEHDSTGVAGHWRAAVALNDMALPLVARRDRTRRDSLLSLGVREARRAVRLAPADPQAVFALALVLGNSALTKGTRDKVRMAVEIRDLALRALAADSAHDGACHILGRWNYEVMKLSGLERFVAKNILGGRVFGQASWLEARGYLGRAVSLDPTRIYHRLDLAKILVATKEAGLAATELRHIAELPDRVAADTTYRREAADLLRKIERGG